MDEVTRFEPETMKNNPMMDSLYNTQGDEVRRLKNSALGVFKNCFIKTADIKGIQKYEKMLNMIPDSTNTVEQRRNLVINNLVYKPPFTRQRFQSMLERIWGQGNYVFEIKPNEFQVILDITSDDPVIYLNFQSEVRKYVPANMYLIFAIQYTHLYLKRRYTYKDLNEKFDYNELCRYNN